MRRDDDMIRCLDVPTMCRFMLNTRLAERLRSGHLVEPDREISRSVFSPDPIFRYGFRLDIHPRVDPDGAIDTRLSSFGNIKRGDRATSGLSPRTGFGHIVLAARHPVGNMGSCSFRTDDDLYRPRWTRSDALERSNGSGNANICRRCQGGIDEFGDRTVHSDSPFHVQRE